MFLPTPVKTGNKLTLKDTGNLVYELQQSDIKHAPDQILAKRKGKNLEINIDVDGHKGEEMQPDIIIENYYDTSSSSLVGMAEDGQYYSYIPQEYNASLNVEGMEDGSFSYQSLGENGFEFPIWILGLGALAFIPGGHSTAAQPIPDEPIPDEPIPDEPIPDEPIPDEPIPDEPIPDEPIPDEPIPDKPIPDKPVNKAPKTNDVSANGPEDSASITITLTGSDIDGIVKNFSLDSLPTNGTLYTDATLTTLAVTGTNYAATAQALDLYFVPDANWNGDTTFTYHAIDNNSLADATSATATITVTPVNDAPETNDVSATGPEDSASITITLTGSDIDGTVEHFSLDSLPINGTLYTDATLTTLAVTGTDYAAAGEALDLYFVPNANWNGDTTFTYHAIDNDSLADATPATATITVTPVNDAPETNNVSANGPEDSASITITLTGSDIDGTVENFSLDSLPINGTLYTDATLTTLAVTGTNYAATGEALLLYFVPNANWNGDTTFTYHAIDNDLLADATPATATITVTPVNDAPVAIDDTNTTAEDTTLTVLTGTVDSLLHNDFDVDGDTLSINGFTVDSTSYTAGDTANLTEGALTINGDGSYTFVPALNFHGPVPVATYTLSDGTLTDTADLNITVTPVNDAPIAFDDTNTTAEDTTLTVLTGSVDNLLHNDTNIDGDTLSITQFVVNGTIYTAGATANLTEGALTINGDGSYTFVPALDFNGAVPTAIYTLSDGTLTDTADLNITVTPVNDAPVAVDDTNTTDEDTTLTVLTGTVYSLLHNDFDVDGDTLTVTGIRTGTESGSGTTGSLGSSLAGTYGHLTLNSDGGYTYVADMATSLAVGATVNDVFTYTISDGNGGTDTAELNITITGVDHGVTVVFNDTNGGAAGDITVYESALPIGSQTPAGGTVTDSGTFTVTAPDGLDHITVGGTDVSLAQLVASSTTPVNIGVTNGTMIITGYDSVTGIVSYSYTLTSPNTTTPSANDGINTTIQSIIITATDVDGSIGADNLEVGVVDDIPAPPEHNLNLSAATVNTNLLFTLDVSESMNDPAGVAGLTRLELSKVALMETIYQYEALGNVKIQIVEFSTNASHAAQWMTVSAAISYLNGITAVGNTNYDAAIASAKDAFLNTSGKLTGFDAQNVAYFVSDGAPNRPIGSVGINGSEETQWINFLTTNSIKSYAIGLGTGVSATNLNPIAYDGIASENTNANVVTNLSALSATLSATVPGPTTHLDLSGGVSHNYFGADGGYISSVTFNGGTYAYNDVTGVLSVSGNNTAGYSYNSTTHVLTQTTANGGVLTLDMDDGNFLYMQPGYVSVGYTDHFDYTFTDGDGDSVSNIANIAVDPTLPVEGVTLTGTSGADIYVGKGGDDTINGGAGNDILYGGDGNDTINGGAGNDKLLGGAGNDILIGGTGADYLFGDIGDDILTIDASDAANSGAIDGGEGFDTIRYEIGANVDFDLYDNGSLLNIEAIDLTANGVHNVTDIKYNDVIRATDSNNLLYILGDSGDAVGFNTSNGWSHTGPSTTSVNGTNYTMYDYINNNDSSVHVYVQSGIVITG